MSLLVRRATEHREVPWRNGGGTTREVISWPASAGPDDFDWRISVADVLADGPFSTFAGVDRIIMLIHGPSMSLTVDGQRHDLVRHRPFPFDGAAATTCRVPEGPTRDLNVMARRGRARLSVQALHLSSTWQTVGDGEQSAALLVLTGSATVYGSDGAAVRLRALDAAHTKRLPLAVRGAGTLAVVRVSPPAPGRSRTRWDVPPDAPGQLGGRLGDEPGELGLS